MFALKGDDRWLQVATDMIHKNECDYVALLFYASWCPFSRSVKPSFDVISLLYSPVPHFAVEESSVKARWVLFILQLSDFDAYVGLKLLVFVVMQHPLQVRSSWVSYYHPFEFNNARSLQGIQNSRFSCCLLH